MQAATNKTSKVIFVKIQVLQKMMLFSTFSFRENTFWQISMGFA